MRKNYTTKILVVDVESTCWDKKPPIGERSEIIEIGVCPIDLREMKIEDPELYIIKPKNSHVSEFCTKLTGTTDADLQRDGVDFWIALQEIVNRHDSKHKCMASWGDYDKDAFMATCDMYGEEYPFGKTHINIKFLYGIMMGKSNEYGLQEATRSAGINFSGIPHRADCDAYNAAVILMRIIDSMRRGIVGAGWLPSEVHCWK